MSNEFNNNDFGDYFRDDSEMRDNINDIQAELDDIICAVAIIKSAVRRASDKLPRGKVVSVLIGVLDYVGTSIGLDMDIDWGK